MTIVTVLGFSFPISTGLTGLSQLKDWDKSSRPCRAQSLFLNKIWSAVLRVSGAIATRAEGGVDGGALPGAADALAAGHVGQLHVGEAAAHLDRLVGEREGGVEEVNVSCVGIA